MGEREREGCREEREKKERKGRMGRKRRRRGNNEPLRSVLVLLDAGLLG